VLIVAALWVGAAAGVSAAGSPEGPAEALLMDFAVERPGASTGTVVEVTDEHATAGKAVKVTFPADAFGWIDCWTPKLRDWSGCEFLAVDVFNPTQDAVSLGVVIRDAAGTGAYDDRFNGTVQLGPGANAVSIPLATMASPGGRRRLELSAVKSWGFSAEKKTVLYFSHLRLEGRKITGLEVLPLVDCDGGQTPNDASIKVFLTDEHVHPGVALGLKCVIAGGPPGSRPGQALWVGGFGTEGVATKSWQSYEYLRFRAYQEGPDPMALALRLRDGEGKVAEVPLTIAAGNDVDCEVDLHSVTGLNLADVSQWGLAFPQSYPKPLYLSYLRLVKGDESRKEYAPKPKRAEEQALTDLRKEAEGARDKLVALIGQARSTGIDTAYCEIQPVVAEVALDYRWFLPACAPERGGYARFVAERCRRAAGELEEALAGSRQPLSVPPPPEVSRLKAVGRHFQDGERPRLIVSAQDGVPGGNALFTGPKFFVGSAAGSGGSRWDVRSAPIWQLYQRFPETHRVGWTGWCGHYISDASSGGGQGETVVICIESPLTRQAISAYIREKVAPVLAAQRDIPIHAINWEAAYVCYCERTRDMFRQFLSERYSDVGALNRVWGTNYSSFQEVELPRHETMAGQRAAWFDFADFNCTRFAGHYAWVKGEIEATDSRKDRLLIGGGPGYAFYGSIGLCGVDLEMLHGKLDKGAILNESGGRFYVTDLLRSIAGPEEMVADVEFHGSRPPLVLGHLLHGDAAIDWCEWLTTSGGYAGLRAIPFNPKYSLEEVELFLRQLLDARRLEREITAFDGAPREVALLYSRTSLLQVPPAFLQAARNPYTAEAINAYAGAQAVGVPLRFLTEKQLVSGQLGETKLLLVPGACYLPPEVYQALLKFVEGGGWAVVTPNSLFFDQYNRPADYLGELGITVTAMEDGSRKKRVTVDLSREDGFVQGEVQEVQSSQEPRAAIRVAAEGPFADLPLTLEGAGVLQELVLASPARTVATFADGRPAMAVVERGKGRLHYLATPLAPASMTALLDPMVAAVGVTRPVTARLTDGSLPSDFECRSVSDGGSWLVYVMNLGDQPRAVTLSAEFEIASVRNLTFGTVASPVLEVPAKDVWLLELKPNLSRFRKGEER
jgi:hypothetical protein